MVELIVDNQSLDLYDSEVISITMAINDLAAVESREGSYSNKFTIPSTDNNNSIFGYPNELNFVTGFKPTKSREARISIDGLDVQRGFIQVEQFNQQKKEFSVSFFSGNTEWIDLISDKDLRDIKLYKYNHIWNPANVAASFSNTSGYIYPFINYGRYNSVAGNNTDLINWLPAMYSHTLIKSIFADIGWKVDGNLFQDPIFLNHILPFSLKDIFIPKEVSEVLGFRSKISLPFAYTGGTPIVYDKVKEGNTVGVYNNATGVYTSNETFVAKVTAKAVVAPFMSGLDRLQIRVNGIVVSESLSNYITDYVSLVPTDTVTITINSNKTIAPINSNFVIEASTRLIEGMTMNINSTLPDMGQDKFISTIFNQFGALFTSDNISKTVYINKFEKIKDNINIALDWTSKIDYSKDIEIDYTDIVSDYGKVNTFGYKENKDASIGNQGENVPPYNGNGSFTIDNDFLSKEEEIFDSEFVSSSNILCFSDRASLMYVPRYSNATIGQNKPNFEPHPRCAINVPSVDVTDIFNGVETSIDIVGTGTTNVTSVPYPYFNVPITGIDKVDGIGQNLSFGDNVTPKIHDNLIESYYSDYVSILNNPRKVTLYVNLNERDINNLDFLIPIYLGGTLNNYFFINKISDYRPMEGGVTKCELVLIV